MLDGIKKLLGTHSPDSSKALSTLQEQAANFIHQKEWDQAIISFRAILAQNPRDDSALYGLGDALYQLDQHLEALSTLQEAIRLNENDANYHYKYGNVLKDLGRPDEAVENYLRATLLNPSHFQALNNLGVVLQSLHQYKESIKYYRKALKFNPDLYQALTNLAYLLQQFGDPNEAIKLYQQSFTLNPNEPGIYLQYATLLNEIGRRSEALSAVHQALTLNPDLSDAKVLLCYIENPKEENNDAIHCYESLITQGVETPFLCSNLGEYYSDLGHIQEAIYWNRRAIQLDPNFVNAHFSLASDLLMLGNFSEGLEEYEWRWQLPHFLENNFKDLRKPLWDFSNGKTILIHAEQGYGDSIQFSRYLSLLSNKCSKVYFQCPQPLKRLIQSIPGISVLSHNENIVDFDAHMPLMSLPRAFGHTLQSIPNNTPYLSAPKESIRKWQQRVTANSGLNVGLCWHSHNPSGANRFVAKGKSIKSIPPELLHSLLLNFKNVNFYSLQKNAAPPPIIFNQSHNWFDWTNELDDFSETAAFIESLDLVISIDTAVAHLAGALGKPVWVLLLNIADWRWLQNTNRCPWYPSMTLFRQPKNHDWETVISQVKSALTTHLLKDKA